MVHPQVMSTGESDEADLSEVLPRRGKTSAPAEPRLDRTRKKKTS